MKYNDTTNLVFIINFHTTNTGGLISLIFFLLAVTIIKLGYFWAHKFTQYLPESSLLLFMGVGFGYILKMTKISASQFTINSFTFMYLLLPPIVLESAFSMYHVDFMANIVAVMIFAIIATVLNFIFLSLSLWVLMKIGILESSINEISILLFCALITSIDPVAVLAIFQEIKVDTNLYYLVFGESLLNDGVAVVLYNVLKQLAAIEVWQGMHYFKSVVSFIAVAIGGGIVGIVVSFATCILSRWAYKSPLSEPTIVFGMSMVAYLMADIVGWSVIISMIMFGLVQVCYNFHNITHKSLIVIKKLAAILANLSESIIFLSLGVTLFEIDDLRWTSSFTLWGLFLCIYIRFVFTFFLSAIINKYELAVREINWSEQYIIAYGGMRGGISYCLAVLLENKYNVDKDSIINATIVIILFTVVFMGITIGPLVRLLQIKIARDAKVSLINQINDYVLMHLLSSMESIVDCKGRYSFYEFLLNVNTLFVRPILQRNPDTHVSRLTETWKTIDFRLYMAHAYGQDTHMGKNFLMKLSPRLRTIKYEFFDVSNTEAILSELQIIDPEEDSEDVDSFGQVTETISTKSNRYLSNKMLAILYSDNKKMENMGREKRVSYFKTMFTKFKKKNISQISSDFNLYVGH